MKKKIHQKKEKVHEMKEKKKEEKKAIDMNPVIKKKEKPSRERKTLLKTGIALGAGIIAGIGGLIITREVFTSFIIFLSIIAATFVYFAVRKRLEISARISKMELVFPDFIELMASNLRAGMTVDSALLLSSRKEFHPLDEEILVLGKDIITGKEMTRALLDMSERVNSDKIKKTIQVITSGIKSGGNLAVLLEETATNMRERNFVEKRAASNVLMYLIFIFFAVAVGAPALFSLSSVLITILTNLLGSLPTIETSANLPITLSSISISSRFITYFSVVFLITIDILASLVIGLVNKGEEKQGTKYILPLIGISLVTYFAIRKIMLGYFSSFIS